MTTTTHSHAVDYTTAGAPNKLLALDANSRALAGELADALDGLIRELEIRTGE